MLTPHTQDARTIQLSSDELRESLAFEEAVHRAQAADSVSVVLVTLTL